MQLLAQNLHKKYKNFTAVKSFSFDLRPGEVLGLLGPNGAGKSTIIGMLYGGVIPTAGNISLGEFNLLSSGDLRKAKKLIGVVPQENNLDPDLSVYENLIVFARYYGLTGSKAKERVDYLLNLTNLTSKREANVEELSGGMKRKLILARALVASPKIVFLDEPTTGLDPDARHELWKLVSVLRSQGVSVLLTTHYMDEAERLCNRIILLQNGEIIDQGSPSELIERTVGLSIAEVYGSNLKEISDFAEKNHLWWRDFADGFILSIDPKNLKLKEELALIGNSEILFRKTNLEDVFLKLTGEKLL